MSLSHPIGPGRSELAANGALPGGAGTRRGVCRPLLS